MVAPGADGAAAVAALRGAGVEDALTVRLERPGAWAAARNRALDLAADSDIMALVDHDVRVDPDWGVAVRDAFGDTRVGAAGGPLRAVGAPLWLDGEGHAEVLGLHDGDPQQSGPFPGGNVAFRIAALRGVGGFFPVRGHAAAHDTVGEDRRAQRELADAGWAIVAAPGMSAARDLSALRPAALLRRRAQTGARAAVLGATDRQAGAVLAARAAASATTNVLRGRRGAAIDRAAWTAAGVGAVLGPALAHAGLQPDRSSTTLRADIPPPASRRRRTSTAGGGVVHGAILLYHRVADIGPDPLGLAVTPEHFAQQLKALAAGWTPAPLEAVIAGEAGPHAVAITFDDGYHDNLVNALPALVGASIPATLFASTSHIATGVGYWWDGVEAALADADARDILTLDLPEGARAWAPRIQDERAAVRAHIHAALRTRDRATIAGALAQLQAWAGQDGATQPPDRDRPLTPDELVTLATAGPFTVQAHGRTHLSLAHTPAPVRAGELTGSADDLASWLGESRRPKIFSYPFGVPGVDVDTATKAAARAAGYTHATINAPGLVGATTDRYAVPRLAVPDVGGSAFAQWLRAALPGRG
ncbi:MAG TPA: polysaccharide deacetylase family protein [Baekduia sp.]|nr:polysaccharide deacetylase family protein [Baekduia sp.]